MSNRRDFLKISTMAAGGLVISRYVPRAWAAIPGGAIDTGLIPKYAERLVIPPAMPPTQTNAAFDLYNIAVRQFQQQILPAGMPPTTVWSYCAATRKGTLNYPAFTIEAKHGRTTKVVWINDLMDARGNYLPHLLPVDPTLHWANPPGGVAGRDMRPMFDSIPGPYTGPVPLVTHVHGAHTNEESDGYPEAWFLPPAKNIPKGYANVGSFYDRFEAKYRAAYGAKWQLGSATFTYPNKQRATTLWYHDHTLGMTRLNVYAGPAGFYLIRGGPDDLPAGVLPGPAPGVGANPFGTYYEVPIAIQDRSFNADGSLFYPGSREFFDGAAPDDPGYIPDTDLSPIWNPEFFGNTMVVNGRTWPYMEVEQRRYRFRFLNGCNSRFLILKFDHPNIDVWQIGTEGGFLPSPVHISEINVGGLGGVLLMALAERADTIVDFTNVDVGTEVTLLNLGPDEPFGGFDGLTSADPATTGQVMQFRVVAATSRDTSTPPADLQLPAFTGLGSAGNTRQVSLNEAESEFYDGPAEALLGTVVADGGGNALGWMAPATETPALGSTEIWEIHNFTVDAHPIHVHQVQFQVVNREAGGAVRPPEPWEAGYKDTVIAYPGEITRIKARFDIPGRFVWHCHIVEHEDNEMMRPYEVR